MGWASTMSVGVPRFRVSQSEILRFKPYRLPVASISSFAMGCTKRGTKNSENEATKICALAARWYTVGRETSFVSKMSQHVFKHTEEAGQDASLGALFRGTPNPANSRKPRLMSAIVLFSLGLGSMTSGSTCNEPPNMLQSCFPPGLKFKRRLLVHGLCIDPVLLSHPCSHSPLNSASVHKRCASCRGGYGAAKHPVRNKPTGWYRTAGLAPAHILLAASRPGTSSNFSSCNAHSAMCAKRSPNFAV